MSDPIQLRKHQLRIGDFVWIGDAESEFEIASLTKRSPNKEFTNADEFVELKVPGHEWGVFSVHKDFVRPLIAVEESRGRGGWEK